VLTVASPVQSLPHEPTANVRDTGRAWFKFVVTPDHETDLAEVDQIVADVSLPVQRVGDAGGLGQSHEHHHRQKMVDAALVRGYGLTSRTHVFLWNDDPDR
jgi:hypothetical protein